MKNNAEAEGNGLCQHNRHEGASHAADKKWNETMVEKFVQSIGRHQWESEGSVEGERGAE